MPRGIHEIKRTQSKNVAAVDKGEAGEDWRNRQLRQEAERESEPQGSCSARQLSTDRQGGRRDELLAGQARTEA